MQQNIVNIIIINRGEKIRGERMALPIKVEAVDVKEIFTSHDNLIS